ncbi:hypothetical protein GYA27_00095 [candidate division WWE3 bacterium]|uniref:Uncharacterized protein n=1 Tax=candidate division WWE3 bacterium TaxID=2053526 RepID=A0A7X9HGH8_UNCKA|nr:hypothetical protein [candidate division WWE3 bacterium]
MEDTINTPQPTQPEESLEELGTKRDFQIRQKKIFFRKVVAVLIILSIIGIGLFVSYIILQRQRTTAPTKPVVLEEVPEEPEKPEDIWELHRDDNLKVFLKIPPEAKLYTYTNPSKVEIVYARNETDFSKINEQTLTDGYIFRVTPLSLGVRDISKITEIKRESFRIQCPESATISDAQDSLVDTIDAKFFTVSNCNVEYIVSYVPRFGIYYEIAQIFRGDIGVGQQHRAKTQELLAAFRFFPEDSPKPYDPNVTYYHDKYNFSIKYPDNMDTSCCDLEGPAKANNQTEDKDTGKLLVAAYLPTYKDKNNFDGFGLFLQVLSRRDKIPFQDYLTEQKQRLYEDYKVVTGNDPVGTEEDIQVGKFTGHVLRGYHWQGTDIIYVDLSAELKIQAYLAVVVKNISGEEFSQVMNKILESFEYYPKLTK